MLSSLQFNKASRHRHSTEFLDPLTLRITVVGSSNNFSFLQKQNTGRRHLHFASSIFHGTSPVSCILWHFRDRLHTQGILELGWGRDMETSYCIQRQLDNWLQSYFSQVSFSLFFIVSSSLPAQNTEPSLLERNILLTGLTDISLFLWLTLNSGLPWFLPKEVTTPPATIASLSLSSVLSWEHSP